MWGQPPSAVQPGKARQLCVRSELLHVDNVDYH
jgi:hypothetical protein